jgi:hypothetical protein
MPSTRVRLIPIGPCTIISNYIYYSRSNFIVIRRVQLYLAGTVVDLKHDTSAITISAISPVRNDAPILAWVVSHPSISVRVSVVDEGVLYVSIDRNRHCRHNVKRLALSSTSGRPEFLDSSGLIDSTRIPMVPASSDMGACVAVVALAVSIDEVLMGVAVEQVAIGIGAYIGVVRIADNLRSIALGNDSEGDCLIVQVGRPWVFTAMVASISSSVNLSVSPHLSVVRSLKSDDSSAVDSSGHFVSGEMIGDDTWVVSRSLPVTAVVMIVVMDSLVRPLILVYPHIANSVRLDNPRYSANRDNLGVETNVQVVGRSMRFNMVSEVGVDLLVVISTVSGVMLTNG